MPVEPFKLPGGVNMATSLEDPGVKPSQPTTPPLQILSPGLHWPLVSGKDSLAG